MHRLAEFIHRRARVVLALTAVLTVLAGVVGAGVVGSLSNGGTSNPSAPSEIAQGQVAAATGSPAQPGLVVLIHSPGPILGPAGRARIEHVVAVIDAHSAISRVASPLNARRPGLLISRGGRSAVVLGYFAAAATNNADTAAASDVARTLRASPGVTVGGDQLTYTQLDNAIAAQLPRVELIAFSILLLLSLLAFRGLVAAVLPLMVGAIAVAGSLLIMRALAQVTTLSVFSLNLVTGLGLGLAIDYSLFIVYRYREELSRCGHCSEALERTLITAGRTVAFSALTVSVALLSLLVFPEQMLSSMGIAAAVVTVFAATAAIIPLAAVLTLLGPRINALAPRRIQRAHRDAAGGVETGAWYRLATGVMRRPVVVGAAAAALLLLVGLPALHLRLGGTDSRSLPPGSSARVVDAVIAREFSNDVANPITAVVHASGDAAPSLHAYARRIARLPGVVAVLPAEHIAHNLWSIELLSRAPALSQATQQLVGAIYAVPSNHPIALAGSAPEQYDQHLSLRSHMFYALLLLGATTMLLLFSMTGSVVLAIKSLLMNLLTLSGAFGILVFVFQDGRLQSLLGYTSTGTLDQTNMIILFIIAFGLSTDYGVFLLARIKEMHETGVSDRIAVASGLQRSGPVVTAAAMLFCAAVGSLAASSIGSLKEFGIGAALAVIIDATIVRALLVPALMALLGRANWWAPKPLRLFSVRSWAHPADVLHGRIRHRAPLPLPVPAPATPAPAAPAPYAAPSRSRRSTRKSSS